MSPSGDNKDMSPRRDLDDRTADALLSGHAVAGEPALNEILSQMRSLADVPAPAPSSALAAMLESGVTPASLPAPAKAARPARPAVGAVSWGRRAWAVPLGAAGFLSLLVGAAAANALPDGAQTAVADVVEAITPLHVPRPHHERLTPVVHPTDVHPTDVGSTPNSEATQDGQDPDHTVRLHPTPGTGHDGQGSSHDGSDSGDSGDHPTARPEPTATHGEGSHSGDGSSDTTRPGNGPASSEPTDSHSPEPSGGGKSPDSSDSGSTPDGSALP